MSGARASAGRLAAARTVLASLLASILVPALAASPAYAVSAPTITNVISAGARSVSIYFLPGADTTGVLTYQYSTDAGVSWQWRSTASLLSPIVTTNTSANGNAAYNKNTTYTFQIRPCTSTSSAASCGPASASFTYTVGTASAPSITSITAGAASLSVNFTPPGSDGGAAITNYQYSTDNGVTWLTRTSGTTASPMVITALSSSSSTALTNGTTYQVQIRAVNSVGNGTASNTVAGTPVSVPGAPLSVTAVPGNGQATIAWTAPASNGGSAVTSYTVTANPSGKTCTTSGVPLALSCSISGLTNGTSYTFTVTATNALGTGSASTASAAVVVGTPAAPTITAASPGNGSITFSFVAGDPGGSPISDFEYAVYNATTATWSAWVPRGSSLTTDWTVSGLTNGTSYSIKMRAKNASGYSAESNIVTTVLPSTVAKVPNPPTITSVVGGDGSLVVSFSVGSDGGAAITNYQYSTNGTSFTAFSPEQASSPLTITGLANGTSYSITLRAVNAIGASANSNTVSGTPVGVPAAIASVSASAALGIYPYQGAVVALSWSAPASNGSSIIGYRIEYSANGGSTYITQTANTGNALTTYSVPAMAGGTSYLFRVTAINAVGYGSPTVSNAVTPQTTPGAPVITTITPGNRTLSVAFTAAPDGGLALSSYEYSTDGGTSWAPRTNAGTATPITITTTSLDGTTIANGTTYQIRIRAVNALGPGFGSSTVAATPDTAATAPSAPVLLSATPASTSVTLAWTPPSSDGGAALTYYVVEKYDASWTTVTSTAPTSPTSYTVTGLTNGQLYQFRVSAKNSAGTSIASNTIAATPATVPSAPTGLVGTPGNETVTLSWTASASNGGSAITSYTVTSTSGGFTCSTSGTTCSISGLTNGTGYTFTVIATNTTGNSAASTTSASVVPRTVPGAPTGVTASAGDTLVHLTWTAPTSNGGSDVTGYVVRYYDTSWHVFGGSNTTSTTTSVDVTSLTNGQLYAFEVAAINAAGTGAGSTLSNSVSPGAAPNAPTNVTAVAGDSSASITWTKPSNNGSVITDYTVTVSPAGGSCTVNVDAATAQCTGLTNGTAYSFTVVATNAIGSSSASGSSNTVTPAVTAHDPVLEWVTPAHITYGTAVSATQLNAAASYGGNSVAGSFSYSYSGGALSSQHLPAGSYTLTATFRPTDTATYTDSLTVTTTLVVDKKTLTVTSHDESRVYGAANPAFTFVVTGFVLAETVSVVASCATPTSDATSASPVDAYSISASSGCTATNYDFTYVAGTLQVTRASLTVTPTADSKTYGASDPLSFGYSVSGLVNGDTETVVTGVTVTRAAGEGVNTYALTASGGSADNYTLSYAAGQLFTISKKTLTVSSNSLSREYGAANPGLTVDVTGFAYSDTVSAVTGCATPTTLADSASNVGAYPIAKSSGCSATNYDFTYVAGTLEVLKKGLTVTAGSFSIDSGASIPAFTLTFTGFVNGETETVLGGAVTLASTATSASAPGSYDVTFTGSFTSGNYTITQTPGTLTIGAVAQSITFANFTDVTYGHASITLGATATSGLAVSYSLVSGPCSLSGTSLTITGSGTCSVKASRAAGQNAVTGVWYSAASDVTKSLIVNKKTLTVTSDDKSRAYGASNPSFTVSVTGFAYSDTVSVVAACATPTTSADGASNVGTYAISAASSCTATNYDFTYVAGTLEITKAAHTISFAAIDTRTYGAADIALPSTTSADVTIGYTSTTTAVCSVTGTAGAYSVHILAAGSCSITAESVADGNYNLATPVAGSSLTRSFTIDPAALTLTVANSTKSSMQAADPSFSYAASGCLGGDSCDITGTAVYARESAPTNTAGTYAVTLSGLTSANSNYVIVTVAGTLIISDAINPLLAWSTPAHINYGTAISVTQKTATATYASNPVAGSFSYSYSGGALTTQVLSAGSHVLTATFHPTDTATYTDSLTVTVTLVVDRETLTITPAMSSKTYGASDPGLTYTVSGLRNGDTASVVSGVLVQRAAGEGVGTYALTASLGSASNYSLAYATGVLFTINRAILVITPVGGSKVYGASDPTHAYSVAGLRLGDGVGVVAGVTVRREGGESVGVYGLDASGGTAANYTLQYSSGGAFSINAAPLVITVRSTAKTEGGADPAFTYVVSGLVNGDASTIVTGVTFTRELGERMGDYAIHATGAVAANYVIRYVPGTLRIEAPAVVFANQTIVFPVLGDITIGDATPRPSATASSGLPVTYAASGSCTVTPAGVITVSGVGQCAITATQAGGLVNGITYREATDVRSFVVRAVVVVPPTVAVTEVKPGLVTVTPSIPSATIVVASGQLPSGSPITSATVTGGQLSYSVAATFSGTATIPVYVTVNGVTTLLSVAVVVNPAAPSSGAQTPTIGGGTVLSWQATTNAVKYRVTVNGVVVCTTTATTCNANSLIGPASTVTVESLGNDATVSPATALTYKASNPVPVLSVTFAPSKSSLSSSNVIALKNFANLVRAEGFTRLVIAGSTDAKRSSAKARALAKQRAQAAAKVLSNLLKIKVTVVAKPFVVPVAVGSGLNARQWNRRADVAIR